MSIPSYNINFQYNPERWISGEKEGFKQYGTQELPKESPTSETHLGTYQVGDMTYNLYTNAEGLTQDKINSVIQRFQKEVVDPDLRNIKNFEAKKKSEGDKAKGVSERVGISKTPDEVMDSLTGTGGVPRPKLPPQSPARPESKNAAHARTEENIGNNPDEVMRILTSTGGVPRPASPRKAPELNEEQRRVMDRLTERGGDVDTAPAGKEIDDSNPDLTSTREAPRPASPKKAPELDEQQRMVMDALTRTVGYGKDKAPARPAEAGSTAISEDLGELESIPEGDEVEEASKEDVGELSPRTPKDLKIKTGEEPQTP